MGKILGLDFGTKKIGVAITDETQTFVFKRDEINNDSKKNAFEKIKGICNEESVESIVLGLPLKLDGTYSKQTDKTKAFAKQLEETIEKEIIYFDERYTTKQSKNILKLMQNKRKEKLKDNSEEAKLILEIYVNMKEKT